MERIVDWKSSGPVDSPKASIGATSALPKCPWLNVRIPPIAVESIARHHRSAERGVIMALDAGLRRQLVAARKNITI